MKNKIKGTMEDGRSKKDFQKRYKKVKTEEKRIHERLRFIANEYAAKFCPYKVGDVVKVKGYAYAGRKARIVQVFGVEDSFNGQLNWKVRAVVLRKDGSDASARFVFWDEEDEERG